MYESNRFFLIKMRSKPVDHLPRTVNNSLSPAFLDSELLVLHQEVQLYHAAISGELQIVG